MQNEFCVRYVFKHVTCEHVLLADSTFHTYTLVIRRSVSYKGTQVVLWNFERVNFFGRNISCTYYTYGRNYVCEGSIKGGHSNYR